MACCLSQALTSQLDEIGKESLLGSGSNALQIDVNTGPT